MATTQEIFELVKALVGAKEPPDADDELAYQIGQLLSVALEELARELAADKERRNELTVTPPFTLEVEDGEASITTLLAAPFRLLSDCLMKADVRDEEGRKLYPLGRDRFDLDQPPLYGYYAVEGNLLFARLAGELPGESDFTAVISGSFVPSLDEVPASCVPDLAHIIARHIVGPSDLADARRKQGAHNHVRTSGLSEPAGETPRAR